MSAETNVQWFYQHNGERKGPVAENELPNLIQLGSINFGTLVWKNGFPEWLKIENTDLNIHMKNVPPPLANNNTTSQSSVNNNAITKPNNIAVWFLAFGPLLGKLSEGIFIGIKNSGSEIADIQNRLDLIDHNYWYIPFFVNMALIFWDYQMVKKTNVDLSFVKKIIVIVPYYLYKRAEVFKDNLAYFIVWIVSFVLLFII